MVYPYKFGIIPHFLTFHVTSYLHLLNIFIYLRPRNIGALTHYFFIIGKFVSLL